MKRLKNVGTVGGLTAGAVLFLVLVVANHPMMAEKTQGKGYLGISVEKLSDGELKEMNLTHGILVTRVIKDGAAYEAGMKENDVIQYFEQEIIHSPGDLVDVVRDSNPGAKVKIKLIREGKEKSVTVTLGRLKEKRLKFHWPGKKGHLLWVGEGAFLGVHIHELEAELAEYFGVKPKKGVLVLAVEEGSPAETAGFKAGDVIVRMGDKDTTDTKAIHEFLSEHEEGDEIEITVVRHRKTKKLMVVLGKQKGFGSWNFFKEKKGDRYLFHVPEIHIPRFHVEVPDGEECRIIVREKLEKVREKLNRVKEELKKKLKEIKVVIHI